ncbi:MAG TPA: zinc-ribbon domain-containing protein [Candidatus Acidoferrum sp.]|nr:zinc-ribbon domain-containing protein [Candidatus Acidoferrum sp.]
MSSSGQGIYSSWNERMRLIRLRRKKERPRFREELKVIPRWLVWFFASLFVIAQIVALLINLSGVGNDGRIWPDELAGHPVLASLALAGIVTGAALVLSSFFFLLGYVYRDAKRRGMNPPLWTLVCLLLAWPFFAIGFIIYFLVREPLPYPCPRCGNLVGPRFNFCSNCKCNLHPSCPNCNREIAETDKFCPYCAQELSTSAEKDAAINPQG